MRILLVEDDEDKREQLRIFLSNTDRNEVIEAKSYQSGLKKIIAETFDLIVLDMTMPTFDVTPTEGGGRPQPFGGKELLQQMFRRDIDTKTIVVTQFDQFGQGDETTTLNELDKLLFQTFPGNYLGIVPYSVTYSGWKDNFNRKMSSNNLSI